MTRPRSHTRSRSRESESQDINTRRYKDRSIPRRAIKRWAVGRDELAPGIVDDTHLRPRIVNETHIHPDTATALKGAGQMLVMEASGDTIDSGGDYVTFDEIVEQHGFSGTTAAGSSWTMPLTAVGWMLTVEFDWDTYEGGGTIELEVAGGVPLSGKIVEGTAGAQGQWTIPFRAQAGESCRLKVTQTSGSAQTANVTVRVALPDPTNHLSETPDLLWLRADSLSGADGSSVSAWSDESGAGNDVAQGTAAAQPTLQTDELNGLAVLRFDGDDDRFTASLSTTSTQPVTIVAVAKNTATAPWTNIKELVSADPDGSTRACGLGVQWDTSGDGGDFYAGNADPGPYLAGPAADTDWHIFEAVFDGASSSLLIDGATVATGNADSDSFAGTLYIGGKVTEGWEGDVAEIRGYSGAVSAERRQAIRNTLRTKWGL